MYHLIFGSIRPMFGHYSNDLTKLVNYLVLLIDCFGSNKTSYCFVACLSIDSGQYQLFSECVESIGKSPLGKAKCLLFYCLLINGNAWFLCLGSSEMIRIKISWALFLIVRSWRTLFSDSLFSLFLYLRKSMPVLAEQEVAQLTRSLLMEPHNTKIST